MKKYAVLGVVFTALTSFNSQAQIRVNFAQPQLMVEQVLNFEVANTPSLSESERSLVPLLQKGLKDKSYKSLYAELTQALGAKGQSAAMSHFLGQIALQLKQNDRALQHFEQAIKANSTYAKAYAGAGLAAIQLEQFQAALQYFSEALKLGVRDPHLYRYLGFAYLEQEQYLSASIAFEQAKLLMPTDRQLDEALVYSYGNSGQSQAALAMLEQMLQSRGAEASLWLQRANVYLSQEAYGTAISSLETALRLGEKQPENIALTAQLQVQFGSVNRAVELYKGLWQKQGQTKVVLDAVNYLIDSGKYTQAQSLLKQMQQGQTAQNANRAQRLFLAGKLAFYQGQLKRSKKQLEQALKLEPIHGQGLLTLAKVYRSQNDSHKASMLLLRAKEVPEVRLQALTELADLQLNLGNTKEALALLRDALQLAPNEQTLINNVNTLQTMLLQQGG